MVNRNLFIVWQKKKDIFRIWKGWIQIFVNILLYLNSVWLKIIQYVLEIGQNEFFVVGQKWVGWYSWNIEEVKMVEICVYVEDLIFDFMIQLINIVWFFV